MDEADRILGSFLCIVYAFGSSMFFLTSRFSNNKVDGSVLDHYFFTMVLIYAGYAASTAGYYQKQLSYYDWLLLISFSVLGISG